MDNDEPIWIQPETFLSFTQGLSQFQVGSHVQLACHFAGGETIPDDLGDLGRILGIAGDSNADELLDAVMELLLATWLLCDGEWLPPDPEVGGLRW